MSSDKGARMRTMILAGVLLVVCFGMGAQTWTTPSKRYIEASMRLVQESIKPVHKVTRVEKHEDIGCPDGYDLSYVSHWGMHNDVSYSHSPREADWDNIPVCTTKAFRKELEDAWLKATR